MENNIIKVQGTLLLKNFSTHNQVTDEGLQHLMSALASTTNYPTSITHLGFLKTIPSTSLKTLTFNQIKEYLCAYATVTISSRDLQDNAVTFTAKISQGVECRDPFNAACLIANGNTSSSSDETYTSSGEEVLFSITQFPTIYKDDWDDFVSKWIIKFTAE